MSVPEAVALAQNQTQVSGESHSPVNVPVFTCAQCGGCCSNVSVLINAEQKATMDTWGWAVRHMADLGLTYEVIDSSRGRERWALPLKQDGTCVFLDDAQACLIQQQEGYAAKPPDCRYFPFSRCIAQIETVDTSASCQTIARGLLQGPIHWQPDDTSDVNPEEATLPERIPVSGRSKSLSLDEYQRWLTDWQAAFLALPDTVPPEQLLRLGVAQQWHLAHANNIQQAVLTCSSKPLGRLVQRIVPLVWGRAPYGIWTRWGVMLGDEICDPRVLGRRSVSLAGVEHVMMPASFNLARRRFVWMLLQRKMPMVYGHSIKSQWLLATVALGLADWYARVFATMAASQPNNVMVSAPELVLAFRVVERYYTGHQPAFPERIRRWPFKQATLQWLLG